MMTTRNQLVRCALLGGLAVLGCTNKSDPTPTNAVPTRGPDSSFKGDYVGVGTLIASSQNTSDAGAGADVAHVAPWRMSVSDDGQDHLVLTVGTSCGLAATVTTRRYDPSGSTGRPSLTLATASVTTGQSCALAVAGNPGALRVEAGEARLDADGALSLVVGGFTASGAIYTEFTFDGHLTTGR